MDRPDNGPAPVWPDDVPAHSLPQTAPLSFAEASSDVDLPGPEPNQPLPSLPLERETKQQRSSGIDWIIPIIDKPHRVKTVGERLQPTLSTAEAEKVKYAFRARTTGYALNIAIGMQVMLGALTTGISAATSGKSVSGISTMVASYLARARGSNEPELSITRVKDLEQFIRECQAFQMDHGHCAGNEFDSDLESLRRRFEELLGNANG
ncbi:hypothetical protein BDZ89DRAFT_1077542 [Hymenopellis radicata]|nr:hypothetical protein BDZ89DRAFT_1077542 [Hymenopellis radicata]